MVCFRGVLYVYGSGSPGTGVPTHCMHSRWMAARHETRTLWPAMIMWDGRCSLRFISTIRIPLDTLQRYAFFHNSLMSLTSPYSARLSLIVRSGTSGGKLAILNFRIPIPAIEMCTWDNSPVSCLNSCVRAVSCSRRSIRTPFVNLMKIRRLGPSIWIILISSSSRSF